MSIRTHTNAVIREYAVFDLASGFQKRVFFSHDAELRKSQSVRQNSGRRGKHNEQHPTVQKILISFILYVARRR